MSLLRCFSKYIHMDQWEINLVKRQEQRLKKERMRLRIRETLVADTDPLEKYVQLQKIEEDIDREITELKTNVQAARLFGRAVGGASATRVRADQHFWRAAKSKVSRVISRLQLVIHLKNA
jgi:hypothetical protein